MSRFVFGGAYRGDGPAWYRIEVPAAALRARGHAVLTVYDELHAHQIQGADAVMVQRGWEPPLRWALEAMRTEGIRTAYELDDDVWAVPRWNPLSSWFTEDHLRGMEACMRAVDVVVVSTGRLAELVSRFNDTVAVVPNAVPLDQVPVPVERTKPGVRIGWAGSHTHERDLAVAMPAVRRILARCPHVTMVFFGSLPAGMTPGPQVEWHDWVHPTDLFWQYAQLQLDLAIAPLAAHRFNESKSPIKVCEYAALGLPVVASDRGPYRVVESGQTGFRVGDHAWERALATLVDNEPLRRQMGAAARRWVASRFSTVQSAPRWEAALAGQTALVPA